ncbi:MAG: hypothetical protein ABWZ76_07670 [Acidimicrobiales bacterium]
MATDHSHSTTSFDLVVPPDPELLRVVRLVASGLASFTELDLDTVEGVRVGADELVSTLIQGGDGSPVTIHFAIEPDHLTITASTTLAGGAHFKLDPLTDRILDEVTSEHQFREDGDQIHGRINIALPTRH